MPQPTMRKRAAAALRDFALSFKAGFQDLFVSKAKAQKTLRQLLEHRQTYLSKDDPARATVAMSLALSLSTGTLVDCMQAEALMNEAQFIFVKKYGTSNPRVARAMHLRGLLHTRLGDIKRAHTFHQAAEVVYDKVRPLSHDRIANLGKLAEAQQAIGYSDLAAKSRARANELSSILLMASVRHHRY
jgi:hypothetical protein